MALVLVRGTLLAPLAALLIVALLIIDHVLEVALLLLTISVLLVTAHLLLLLLFLLASIGSTLISGIAVHFYIAVQIILSDFPVVCLQC